MNWWPFGLMDDWMVELVALGLVNGYLFSLV